LFLLVQHGAAWLAVKSEGELHARALRYRRVTFWICAVLAVATSAATIIWVSRASDNVFGRPAGWLFLVVFLAGVLYTIWQMMKQGGELGSFVGSAIIIVGLAGIAAVGNFPDMVPARDTPAITSLTVERAASGHLTLLVMLILAVVFVPLVLVYTALVYKTFWGKTRAGDADY
jgi:cytochrome d ubiquinol oxidase subunit II